MPDLTPDSAETCNLLDQVEKGNQRALEKLLERHRPDLRAFIAVRLDPRLAARLDPSDVVQEAQLEVVRRMDDFLSRRPMPFYVWLRKTAYQRLLDLRRHHRRGRRSVEREAALPERSSLLLARPLLAGAASPSQQAQARELAERVARAVADLPAADQEVLLMRHGEGPPFAATMDSRQLQRFKNEAQSAAAHEGGSCLRHENLTSPVRAAALPSLE